MASNAASSVIMKWKEVKDSSGVCPKPRHGHRCIAYGKYIIIIGGGNEGIIREINVYNSVNGKWFYPSTSYASPPGCAAFGVLCHGSNLLLFGGIYEQGAYSNDIYKISLLNWSWKLCESTLAEDTHLPCPRLGHSFTLSLANAAYMFGGLTNENAVVPNGQPCYLNDLYKLTISEDENFEWSVINTSGTPPCPRESHSAVIYPYSGKEKLVVYGGMCGRRLGDIHFLDLETLYWSQPVVLGQTPPPRSLHVADVCRNKMIVFGGWVPAADYPDNERMVFTEKDWKCTNNVYSFNFDALTWENVCISESDELVPRPRAGHCGVMLNERLYIWSGRDGFRKSWNDQVCCKDLWFLETSKAQAPIRIMMDGSDTLSVSIKWDVVPNADFYIIQVMKVGANTVCNSHDVKTIIERNLQTLNRESRAQGLPALKLVTPIRPEERKTSESGDDSLINSRQSIRIGSDIVDLRSNWLQGGEKMPTFQLVQKPDDTIQSANPIMSSTFCDTSLAQPSASIKPNGLEVAGGKLFNLITPEDLYSQPFAKTPIMDSCPSKNIPPLGITLYPQPRQTILSPKKHNVFSDIPLGRWMESAIVSEARAVVTQFYIDIGYEKPSSARVNLNRRNVPLEPNYTYRLRIASVNSCGIGPFGAPLTFSTSAPGLPGPPSNVKVVKRGMDTYLVWSPLMAPEQMEYSVYVSMPITSETVLPVNISHFSYIYEHIYQGKDTKCSLSSSLDTSLELTDKGQSYLMLRIVAKNAKGYGPVTQIKWYKNEVQDFKSKKTIDKLELPLKRFRPT